MAKQSIPARWVSALLEAVRLTKANPPRTARKLALLCTAMYDAWACFHDVAEGTRLGRRLRRPPEDRTKENRERAISYAAYYSLTRLFPNLPDGKKALFEELMLALKYDTTDTSESFSSPVGIGNFCARLVLENRRNDGANQATGYGDYTGFQPPFLPDTEILPQNSDKWIPLKLNGVVQSFLLPHWGLVTPFAMPYGSNLRPVAPPAAWNSVLLKDQAQRVIELSAKLDDERKAITEYWMDGPATETPPGHWFLLSQFVSKRDDHGIGKDVKLFLALSNALLEASIVAWDTKFHFYTVRPITYIQWLYANKTITAWGGPKHDGPKSMLGKEWMPYQKAESPTPPFPEFVSGHSTFSSAAAEILKRFTGSDRFGAEHEVKSLFIQGKDLSAKPVKLHWGTFSEAAAQAGMS
ncbi:MAG: vanadium-dependent haloperoxidase, partial [Bacteroidota bacterium]